MDSRSTARCYGIVIYPGVEPIDIGGTLGVISMARQSQTTHTALPPPGCGVVGW